MRKFKIGDTIECIESISANDNGPLQGERYKITSLEEYYVGFKLFNYNSPINREKIRHGIYPNWGIRCFKLIESKPLTEVDYLDAFQNNFRDGI